MWKYSLRDISAPRYKRKILTSLAWWSKLGALPLDIDPVQERFEMTKSKTKLYAFKFQITVNAVQLVYIGIQLLRSVSEPGVFRVEQFGVHAAFFGTSLVGVILGVFYFFYEPELTVRLFNATHGQGGVDWSSVPGGRLKLTPQRFFLSTMAEGLAGCMACSLVFIQADCSRSMHWYHVFDSSGECPSTVGAQGVYMLSIVLGAILVNGILPLALAVYAQLYGLEFLNGTLSLDLENIERDHRWSASTAHSKILRMREHQLNLRWFNMVHGYPIFWMKQFYLAASILCSYICISYFSRHIPSGILMFMVGFYTTVEYAVIYEKGYEVPHLMEYLKREMMVGASKKSSKLLNCQIRSIRTDGVRVGSFTIIERISTPEFIEFASTKIATMLITFPSK